MNMHGIMTPAGTHARGGTPWTRARHWLWQRRMFGLVVVLPTLLLAGYLFLIASDQYESEAHFLVRSQEIAPAVTGVSAAISMVTGSSNGQSEAMSVADYLTSHDAVEALARQDNLVARFHRPDIDRFSRLGKANPSPEQLLKYYRNHVLVNYNTDTGITTLRVRSFRPTDSYELMRKLLMLGESRVNILNTRSYADSVATARRQLDDAEVELAGVQSRLTRFRQDRGDIDPQASGQAQITMVAGLNGQLAAARAQLNAMGDMIDRSSPQYRAVAARVNALQAQISTQTGRIAGGSRAIASNVSGYQELQIRQQFLAQRYQAAAGALDKARDQALRQQLYLVRVVEPNLPVKALYPERWRILTTAVIALFLAYSIGWLIVAGVREHAA